MPNFGLSTKTTLQTRNRHLLAWLHGDLSAKMNSLRIMIADLQIGVMRRRALLDLVLGRFGKQNLI